MKIALSWLKEFVDVPSDPRQLAADLTMIGLNVESYAAAGDDWVLEVEVTTNRPDCLSHYGMARELATVYRKPLKRLEFVVKGSTTPVKDTVTIEIADPELCARYCGRVVRNVEVKPSPAWLQQRLEAVGQRTLNNVADVTNYVLLELGHPLHAFDLWRLRQRKIIVRRARPGEPLRTLDGIDRTLSAENLVIADGERPVALAGVMGGEESEIYSSTRTVLLESAWFQPLSIRRTSKVQGLHTEASHRFERGADVAMARVALDRAATLITQVAGGEILAGVVDVYPGEKPREDFVLRRSEILRILGAEVSWEEVERILRALGFETVRRGTEGWRVTPPTFRLDVTREVDLIEEVARHYGYDRLPARVRPAPPRVARDLRREKLLKISALLVALGYHEIIPPALLDPEENARFTDKPPVRLANPLTQDASALRSTTLPSMVNALRWNLDRDQRSLRLFEIGKTYTPRPEGLPEERWVLTLGLSGYSRVATVHESETPFNFFDLKGDAETLLQTFDLPGLTFEAQASSCYEAGAAGRLVADGKALAGGGRLNRDLSREYKLREPVWLMELDLEPLLEKPLRASVFHSYSKFPAVERDFSLLAPDAVPYGRLEEAIRRLDMPEIQDSRPVELFRGGAVPAGQYSLLLRVTFQSADRTLTSEELNEAGRRLLAALEPLGVRLRS